MNDGGSKAPVVESSKVFGRHFQQANVNKNTSASSVGSYQIS